MNMQRLTHDEAIELAALYVLGALEPSEEAAVRDHLATCELEHPEFAELGGIVPALLEDVDLVEPPAGLRDRIMAAAAADLAERARSAAPGAAPTAERTPPAPTADRTRPVPFPSADQREARLRARIRAFDWAVRIAAVIAIVVAGAWGLGLQSQLDAARQYDQQVAAVIKAAGEQGAQTVILKPGENQTANGIAAIRSDGSVVIAMRNLKPTSGSQVYETWVISGDNAPVPVGGFAVGSTGQASFTTRPSPAPPGATIAFTLEAQEGAQAPTLPIVSAGTAVGGATT
jgi:anti-sigma factor RsiW